jgi:Leucine-rich repeat (LRR) protein
MKTESTDKDLKITQIRMPNNNLYSIPSKILRLNDITSLTLNNNKISDITDICSLVKLRTLNLQSNLITTIPDSISNLTSLTSLDLSDNLITRLPRTFGKLNCMEIFMEINLIKWLPIEILHLPIEFSFASYENLNNMDIDCEYISVDYLSRPLENLPINLQAITLFNPIISIEKIKLPFGCKLYTNKKN